jgi:hypothetical protein
LHITTHSKILTTIQELQREGEGGREREREREKERERETKRDREPRVPF